MAEFHFIRPLWLLAIIPSLTLWWALWRKQQRSENFEEIIDPHLLEYLLVGEQNNQLYRFVHLLLVVWIIAVIAVSGPSWRKEISPFLSDEAGLMVLLKTAKTMESTDVQPSRLERAKQKIRDIVEIRKNGATGLIVYSGSAHLVMPLSRDERMIKTMLEGLSADLMPVDGDLLSEALQLGEKIVGQSGLPGSMLIIADSSAEQFLEKNGLPVQVLALQPAGRAPDAALVAAAKALDGPLIGLALDTSDVEQIAARAKTSHRNVAEPGQTERWKDGGYLLLPLTAAAMLLWFRKGWVLG